MQPVAAKMLAEAPGAPIRVGWARPLRVATSGDANWCSSVIAAARPPTRIDGAITPKANESMPPPHCVPIEPMNFHQNVPEEA